MTRVNMLAVHSYDYLEMSLPFIICKGTKFGEISTILSLNFEAKGMLTGTSETRVSGSGRNYLPILDLKSGIAVVYHPAPVVSFDAQYQPIWLVGFHDGFLVSVVNINGFLNHVPFCWLYISSGEGLIYGLY